MNPLHSKQTKSEWKNYSLNVDMMQLKISCSSLKLSPWQLNMSDLLNHSLYSTSPVQHQKEHKDTLYSWDVKTYSVTKYHFAFISAVGLHTDL